MTGHARWKWDGQVLAGAEAMCSRVASRPLSFARVLSSSNWQRCIRAASPSSTVLRCFERPEHLHTSSRLSARLMEHMCSFALHYAALPKAASDHPTLSYILSLPVS